MMPFPITMNGSISVQCVNDTQDIAEILESNIESWLESYRATDIRRTPRGLTFKAGFRRVGIFSSWNPLLSIHFGRIAINLVNHSIAINYHFRYTEMFLLITGVMTFLFVPFMWEEPIYLVIGWMFMMGGNYLYCWYRVRSALQKMAHDVVSSDRST